MRVVSMPRASRMGSSPVESARLFAGGALNGWDSLLPPSETASGARIMNRKMVEMPLRCGAFCLLVGLLAGCIHVEIFHPDVGGTYHLGADRPYWTYEGAVAHAEIPPVDPSAQETPSWCWAAAAQMLLRSQGVEMSQSEIVRRAYGDTRQAGGKSPLIVQAISGAFTRNDGKTIRIEAHRSDGFPDNGLELLTSIQEGRPFILDFGYYKNGKPHRGEAFAAHSVLVCGMTYRREGNLVHILSLDTIDPSYAMIQQSEPGYGARQKMDASVFDAIQGTVGIYQK